MNQYHLLLRMIVMMNLYRVIPHCLVAMTLGYKILLIIKAKIV